MVAKNTVDEGMEFRRNFIAGTSSKIKKVELVNTHTHNHKNTNTTFTVVKSLLRML